MPDKKKYNHIAIASIWYERVLEASRNINTNYEVNSIWKLYYSLINIGEDKLAIRDIVQDYINQIWQPKVNQYYEERIGHGRGIPELELTYHKDAERRYIRDLFNFITQTIQDSGVGWPTQEEMQTFLYTTE